MNENSINRFKELLLEIQKYEKLRLTGYLTAPLIVGFFILKKEVEIILALRNYLHLQL